MRLGKYALLLLAATLAACNNDSTGVLEGSSKVLLEIEYINYAWTPTFAGYYVDGSGNVFSYDRRGTPWPYGEEGAVSAEQLNEKFSIGRRLEGRVDTASLGPIAAKIALVNRTQLSAPKQQCADAGVLTYRAYSYNASTGKYEPILLRAEGDAAQENTSTAAQDLVAYIRSLGLFQEMPGCDP